MKKKGARQFDLPRQLPEQPLQGPGEHFQMMAWEQRQAETKANAGTPGPGQGTLFDMPEAQPREVQHPGQLSYPEWLKRSDITFHGSMRGDWEGGLRAHTGTQSSAADRLIQIAANKRPEEKGPGDMPEGGRLFARRVTEPIAMHLSGSDADSEANAAEWLVKRDPDKLYQGPSEDELKRWSPSRTGKVSIGHQQALWSELRSMSRKKKFGRLLREGRPVSYQNATEDRGSTSLIAPRGTLRAWHEDVNEALDLGLEVHPHDVPLAKQQFDPALQVTPSGSMPWAAERWASNDRMLDEGQKSLLPWMVTKTSIQPEKYFEERPEDTNLSGRYHDQRGPGHDAHRRAQRFARMWGGQVMPTTPHAMTEFPEGVARLKGRRKH